ncbi:MAG TPA: nucleotidyltransferase domain-containing protein [Thermoplasmata archaeon]|nr:nucleotidyltransferase domain-containing protein [Thermoplasmata archaeon]
MNTDPRPPSRLPVGRVIRHRGVLRALFAAPPAGSTIRELAIRSGVPYASTWRLVEDLRRLGALRVEVIGPSRRVSVNAGSPLLDDLRRIAGVEFDPHRKAARRFADLASKLHAVRKVILFGSVSRGEETVGSDVDLAVVLDRETRAVRAHVDRLAGQVVEETGLPVVPTLLTQREMTRGGSFPRTLAAGEVLYERS